jgi:hypothetical protein
LIVNQMQRWWQTEDLFHGVQDSSLVIEGAQDRPAFGIGADDRAEAAMTVDVVKLRCSRPKQRLDLGAAHLGLQTIIENYSLEEAIA